ncbi:FAD dependent oxidoreductase [Lasiodiplodia theobromae]|uniref:FAD dependent oxidoreductase n=1 Tax=Lasiodiplodia theobromae TaxID=45133 RepID=UPI0015C3D44F|nr:FAD dependent oxidoreductase [Lasiodiplodia theobromae]KAF4544032.1 FAD dependent oxidoreductase [Lasiodiplodia theobromae]
MGEPKSVAIVGAGVFGLSLAVALKERGYKVTVFDQHRYDETGYLPGVDASIQAASVDENKIFRASYGTKLHYQRLALESREAWCLLNETRRNENPSHGDSEDLFVGCGMLRVQPTEELGALERETLANMERAGLRDTQFVKGNPADCERAASLGWASKLLQFEIPDAPVRTTYEAVLDSLAGFTKCSEACAHFQKVAAAKGVEFRFGSHEGAFDSLIESPSPTPAAQRRAVGLKTRDGVNHKADVVVIAAGSFSTQLLPDLSYHLESSGGSIATFKIDRDDSYLWDKYSPEKFPVMTWKSAPRDSDGKDTGSVYVFPRTPDGLVKIGYRGIKVLKICCFAS